MQFYQLLRDGQAKPETEELARRRRVLLAEPLEYVRQELRRNALAIILHGNLYGLLEQLDAQFHASPAVRELQGVVHDIPEHLLEPARVSLQLTAVRVDHSDQLHALFLRDGLQRLHRRLNERRHVYRRALHDDVAGHQPVHVEQIVDEPGLQLRVPTDDRKGGM